MAEESRKPFKTISLEERLKNSSYNDIFKNTNPTNASSPLSQNKDLDTIKSNPSIPSTDKDKQSPKINERGEPQDKTGQSPEVSGTPTSSTLQGSPNITQSKTTQDKSIQSPEVDGIPTSQNKNSNTINLPQSQLTLPKEGAILKDTINLADKTSPILKTLADSPQAQIDSPRTFSTAPLSNAARPTGFTAFASSISLENRLKQYKVTQTRHLPQYFLTDLYTGYLTITPFITPTIDNQNIGQIPEFITTAIQDTQGIGELAKPSEDVLSRQDPKTEVKERKENTLILTRQGTFISNNVVSSFVDLVDPKTPAQIVQGEIELPIWNVVPNQGITVEEQTPFGDLQIAVLQGMIVENGLIVGSRLDINTEVETLQIENLPIPENGQISSDVFNQNKAKAFDTPLAFHGTIELGTAQYDQNKTQSVENPEGRHGVAQLSVNEYLVSRTLAFGSPAIFHGTEIISPFEQDLNRLPASAPSIESTPYTPEANVPLPPEYAGLNTNKYTDANPIKGPGKQNPDAHTPDVQSLPATISHAAALTSARKNQDDKSLFMELRDTEGNKIRLTPYLTSFSDGISATWKDIKHAGRMDTLKSYEGSTRAVSFAIQLPAFNKAEVDANMKKLEQIINMCVVGKIYNNIYIKSPLVRLRIGGLINSWCAFSSVKWDFDPADATWGAEGMSNKNTQLPSFFKVQFDCAVLSRNDEYMLDGAKGGYFAKTYT